MSLGIQGGGAGRAPTLSSSSASLGDPAPVFVPDPSHRDAPEQVVGSRLAPSSHTGAQVPSPVGPVAPVLPGGSPSPCPTGGEPADPVQAGRPPGPGRQLHPPGQRLGDGAAEPAQDPLHRHPAPQLPGAPADAQRRAAGTAGMPRGWAATSAGPGGSAPGHPRAGQPNLATPRDALHAPSGNWGTAESGRGAEASDGLHSRWAVSRRGEASQEVETGLSLLLPARPSPLPMLQAAARWEHRPAAPPAPPAPGAAMAAAAARSTRTPLGHGCARPFPAPGRVPGSAKSSLPRFHQHRLDIRN